MRAGASIIVTGIVQGVGFRPFVYRLARECLLTGFVRNTPYGVEIRVEGEREAIEGFARRLREERPALSQVEHMELRYGEVRPYENFSIVKSEAASAGEAVLLPDTATCPDCVKELFDPSSRRYRYPFTTCTTCGPRFSIARAIPFDRESTTMSVFTMCPACRAEYENPADRRFHSQTNSCAGCGPSLVAMDREGRVLDREDSALLRAAECIRAGGIVALKGVGGFQLLLDARSAEAVAALRVRKHRQAKPFALMVGQMSQIEGLCEVNDIEKAALCSPAAPIVLMRAARSPQISPLVASGLGQLGVMLPYSPVHHLILAALEFPLVCTSGNISDEPICINDEEALARLGPVADLLLTHDRDIVRGLDDSVVRVMGGAATVFRRARGYAPLSINLPRQAAPAALAVGGHLKNTIALFRDGKAHLSQHLGNLETAPACEIFEREIGSLSSLYGIAPAVIVRDRHPDYYSSAYAEQQGTPVIKIQHHLAHAAGCMAEHRLKPPALGVSFDGTGYGMDRSVWGGEFLVLREDGSWERVGHLRTFRLPGGETAIEEPRRAALGVLYELFGERLKDEPGGAADSFLTANFGADELSLLVSMLSKGVNSPVTSSAGRLFDAVSALAGIRTAALFEGQAAMELEAQAMHGEAGPYPVSLRARGCAFEIDWEPMIMAILRDKDRSAPKVARAFHEGLCEGIVQGAKKAGLKQVVLSGGVFQNRLLTELAAAALLSSGFEVYLNRAVPPNDGGVSFGQIAAALMGYGGEHSYRGG